MKLSVALTIAVAVVAAAGVAMWRYRQPTSTEFAPSNDSRPPATFVGQAKCAECHRAEAEKWRESDHARAMMTPEQAGAIAAPFAGERFTQGGVTTTFSKQDASFFVRTDGPDGVTDDFQVRYTFGVYPLQQYLLGAGNGRLQALSVAWDNRSKPEGQKWFHLYPDATKAGDVQHWTSPSQNWNLMCADCHSTNLRKRYNADNNSYNTTWTDVSVGCESCHGAGSNHIAWARMRGPNAKAEPGENTGLAKIGGRDGAGWTFDPATGIAHRNAARASHVEVETCARCHSRRSQLTDDHRVGSPIADSYRPALLDDGLYFADGQIREEVYEYGSFLQSRMYANGVTCSDCHEPHKPEIKKDPDQVCQRCHLAAKFAQPTHHHHAAESAGSSCVACHMPSRTYMTVDVRRDHSFRVPRPDLTVAIGTPNACATCHEKQPAAWAADKVASWRSAGRTPRPHFAEAIAAGRSAAADAEPRLLAVVSDPQMPAIARATAISLLARWLDARSVPVLIDALRDPDPLVRLAAVDVLANIPIGDRAQTLMPLVSDNVRSVRIAAARAVALVPDSSLSPADRDRRGRALTEWEQVQKFNADTAGAHVNLGALYAERGDHARAKQEYETALRLEPYFAPAAVNLADVYRATGDDANGEKVLRAAIARTPSVSTLHHSLGLLLARRKDLNGSIAALTRAAQLAPDDIDAHYTLAVALYSAGRRNEGIAELDRTWRRHPGDRTTLSALISYVRETGDLARAETLAMNLVQISPEDPRAKALLSEIQRARR